jgi:hypothetical protein
LTTGWLLSLFQRASVGAFTSRGNDDCTAAMRSRTSCHRAVHVGVQAELDDIVPCPSARAGQDALDAGHAVHRFLQRLDQSRSTASGEAPGYCTSIQAPGS